MPKVVLVSAPNFLSRLLVRRRRSAPLALTSLAASFVLAAGCVTVSQDGAPSAPLAAAPAAATPTAAAPTAAAPTAAAPTAATPLAPTPVAAATEPATEPEPSELAQEPAESEQPLAEAPAAEAPAAEAPAAEAPAAVPAPAKRIHAAEGLVKIYDAPHRDGNIIGALRAGQSVALKADDLSDEDRLKNKLYLCEQGWYGVEPRGYVCAGGPGFGGGFYGTFNGDDPQVVASRAALPDVSKDYPFHFGVSIGAPAYKRIPTQDEQRQHEKELDKHLANLPAVDDKKGGAVDATPAGRPPSDDYLRYLDQAKPELLAEQDAFRDMKVAWTEEFDANGRTWLLTADMTLIPKDKVRTKPLPRLKGIDLRENPDMQLPIAFFWLNDTNKFRRGEDGKLAETADVWPRHAFVSATTNQDWGPGGIYWEMKSGDWVKYQNISMIRRNTHRPPGVGPNDKWVEARVTWGYLIAYEGDEPVYVTAMSPGMDGINPRKHATARGRHHVGWKMLTADMSGRDNGADWLVDEVPWVQYYKGSYALHGAWWHNDFGRPKSHGCVNLSPPDAKRMFDWMDPQMPDGWYAVTSYYPKVKGTLVYVRP